MSGVFQRPRGTKHIALPDPPQQPIRIRTMEDLSKVPELKRFLGRIDDVRRAVLFRVLEAVDTDDLERKLELAAAQQLEETPSLREPWRAYDKVCDKLTERFIAETYRLARTTKFDAPRMTVAAEPSEWRVRLRPEGSADPISVIVAANPEAVDPNAHPPDCLTPGCGPGPLVWQVAEDAGVPGLVAPSGRGRFKILHVSGATWALFYEHETGGWDELGLGSSEALKRIAATRAHTASNTSPAH